MTHHPIGDLAFLSDMHSAALVDRAGTVAWLAFPRFDSPSVFGSLLGDEAGHWHIRPVGDHQVTRRYLEDSLVLETTFTTPGGTAVLTDALALAADDQDHLLGAGAPLRCCGGCASRTARWISRSSSFPDPSTASTIR